MMVDHSIISRNISNDTSCSTTSGIDSISNYNNVDNNNDDNSRKNNFDDNRKNKDISNRLGNIHQNNINIDRSSSSSSNSSNSSSSKINVNVNNNNNSNQEIVQDENFLIRNENKNIKSTFQSLDNDDFYEKHKNDDLIIDNMENIEFCPVNEVEKEEEPNNKKRKSRYGKKSKREEKKIPVRPGKRGKTSFQFNYETVRLTLLQRKKYIPILILAYIYMLTYPLSFTIISILK